MSLWRPQTVLRRWAFVAALLGAAVPVHAHPMPLGQGTLNVVGSKVYFSAALARTDFPDFPVFPDLGEHTAIAAQTAAATGRPLGLATFFERAVVLRDGAQLAQWRETLVMPSASDDAAHVFVVAVAEFAQAPQTLTVEMNLLGPQEVLTLRATRTHEGQPGPREVGLVSQAKPHCVFFAPWWQRLGGFAHEGFTHIMEGWDHLLFLVALLVTGITVRRWATLLTGFTLAHGVTFGLARLGWVHAPTALVEPAIAASIAVVACLHLLGLHLRLRWELALVMALGLIHGLGFASALQAASPGGANVPDASPMLGIVGFNLGVEAGQAVVAALVYALVTGLPRLVPRLRLASLQRLLSAVAAAMACYWLLQRI